MTAGYSGTPLAKKLGIKVGTRVGTINEPPEFRALVTDPGGAGSAGSAGSGATGTGLPEGATIVAGLDDDPDLVVGFYTIHQELKDDLDRLAEAIFPDGAVWLAWPKQSSGVDTDLTRDIIRTSVLVTKLVDVKVCAISDTWSGLKVSWRKEHRQP